MQEGHASPGQERRVQNHEDGWRRAGVTNSTRLATAQLAVQEDRASPGQERRVQNHKDGRQKAGENFSKRYMERLHDQLVDWKQVLIKKSDSVSFRKVSVAVQDPRLVLASAILEANNTHEIELNPCHVFKYVRYTREELASAEALKRLKDRVKYFRKIAIPQGDDALCKVFFDVYSSPSKALAGILHNRR